MLCRDNVCKNESEDRPQNAQTTDSELQSGLDPGEGQEQAAVGLFDAVTCRDQAAGSEPTGQSVVGLCECVCLFVQRGGGIRGGARLPGQLESEGGEGESDEDESVAKEVLMMED